MREQWLKQIFGHFSRMNRIYDGEDGAGTGADTEGGGGEEDKGPTNEELYKDSNVPLEIQDDPEIREEHLEIYNKAQEEKGEEENGESGESEEGGSKEKGDEETITFEKEDELLYKPDEKADGEQAVVESVNDDGTFNIKVGDKVIENVKQGTLAKEVYEYSFEEDVTVGEMTFKKEDLAKIPAGTLENIGQLVEANKELTEKVEKNKGVSDTLLNDPVVKERMGRIDAGKADEGYATYGMSKETHAYLKDSAELDEDEIKEANKHFLADMDDNVNRAVNDALIGQKTDNDKKAAAEKGMKNLFDIGEVNEEFAIKETNLEKIVKMGAKHPDYENYTKGIGKIQEWLIDHGMDTYSSLQKYDAKTLYNMSASDLGNTVAMNTGARDKKIRDRERSKILEVFGGKRILKHMTQKSTTETTKNDGSILNEGALDENKLNDMDYLEARLDSAQSDEEIFRIQRLLIAAKKQSVV